jgi:hypothetical protein
VEVSLVYKNRRLQFEPPLEVLRLQHFARHLDGFLGLPLRMKGVSSLSERQGFFAPIADADPAAIARVRGRYLNACASQAARYHHQLTQQGIQQGCQHRVTCVSLAAARNQIVSQHTQPRLSVSLFTFKSPVRCCLLAWLSRPRHTVTCWCTPLVIFGTISTGVWVV